jgi:hypothetical protein
MTSKEKIGEILDWVQNATCIDWSFMCCLKQDLEHLVNIAQLEGVREVKNVMNEFYEQHHKIVK